MKEIKISFFGIFNSAKNEAAELMTKVIGKKFPMSIYSTGNISMILDNIQNIIYKDLDILPKKDKELTDFLNAHFSEYLGPRFVKNLKMFRKSIDFDKLNENGIGDYVFLINNDCQNNAYKSLKDEGFIFVKVDKPFDCFMDEEPEEQIQKVDQIIPDYVITNHGNIDELEEQISNVLDLIVQKYNEN